MRLTGIMGMLMAALIAGALFPSTRSADSAVLEHESICAEPATVHIVACTTYAKRTGFTCTYVPVEVASTLRDEMCAL